jgi:hypothetical protein
VPDKPAPKAKKPSKTVVYVVGGVIVLGGLYYLYEKWTANGGSLSSLLGGTATDTTPADTTPTTTTTAPTTTTPTTPTFGTSASLGEWKTRILDYMVNTAHISGGENIAATGLADALSGHCVGPNEYAALNSALGAIGQPPGAGTLTLKKCTTKPTTTTTHTPTETPPHQAAGPPVRGLLNGTGLATGTGLRQPRAAPKPKPTARKPIKIPEQVRRALKI